MKKLLLFVLMLLPMVASADDSGKCGENVYYSYNSTTHTLTISGQGKMENWAGNSSVTYYNHYEKRPWDERLYKRSIKSIIIEPGVTSVGDMAFYQCSSLTSITIPSSVTSIGNYAFSDCSSLSSITIPNSVTSIGNYYVFYGCKGLKTITLEIEKPFEIDSYTFDSDTYNVAELIVPEGTKAAYQATEGWNKFAKITEAEVSEFYVDGIYYIVGENNAVSVTSGEVKYSGDVVIPSQVTYNGKTYTVTSIGGGVFSGCSGLTSVTIPNGVTSIGESTFSGCSGLTSVTIPSSVTSIGSDAFFGTPWFNNQPNGLVYAGKLAYKYKGDMPNNTSIIIEDGTVGIADAAFRACSGLTSVTIPNSVTSIGNYAFSGCSGLTSVTIPNSVTSIKFRTFYGCSGLTSVIIPHSVKSIDSQAFEGCSGLTSVVSEIENPFAIDGEVFYGIPSNATLIVPKGKKTIYQSTFAWNYMFTNIVEYEKKKTIHVATAGTLPDLIQNYEKNLTEELTLTGELNGTDLAFLREMAGRSRSIYFHYTGFDIIDLIYGEGWSQETQGKLIELDIVNANIVSGGSPSLQLIEGDLNMTKIYSLDNTIPAGLFFGCKLSSIKLPLNISNIESLALGHCPLTSITIPNSVTSIGGSAFWDCSGLTSVSIPNSVTSIGYGAFSGTSWFNNQPNGLVYAGKVAYEYKGDMANNISIIIEDGTLGIANGAFYGCSGMTSVTIPNSVTSIGGSAFSGCSDLISVTIPISVTSIGEYAFFYCSGLTTITSEIEKPFEIASSVFEGIPSDAELIVPKGTKALYQATEGWNKFTRITEAADKDEALFSIDGITYEGTKSAKTVMVKSVDKSQTSIEIPASVINDGITYQVTGVTDDAFKGCSMGSLIWNVEATLPNNAFSNASIGSNFLLYVKSADYAPSSVKNVVVNGTAQTIVLSDDGGQYYCPQAFTARSISYTHNYSMETGGNGKGWETIALPFDVQKISHNTRGEIVPFPAYNSSSNQKPFWLAIFSGSGFRRTAAVLANEPYIIAMPNSTKYQNNYNLAGDVTFSSENIQVQKTPSFSGTFVPAFATVAKSSSVYALNVNNHYVKYTGSYYPGSRFISGLRDIRPFEAYLTGNFTRSVIEIGFDDDTTSLNEEIRMKNEESADTTDSEIVIYTLSAQQVAYTTQRNFNAVWQQLPKGVYIVNGKKMIK